QLGYSTPKYQKARRNPQPSHHSSPPHHRRHRPLQWRRLSSRWWLADNLAVQQKLQLPENLAGKSLLTAKGDMLYAVSDSGVTVLPVGYLNQLNRVQSSKPDMVFRGDFCDRTMVTQEITILDPGGNH